MRRAARLLSNRSGPAAGSFDEAAPERAALSQARASHVMRGEGRARLAGPRAARRGLHGGPRRPRLFLVSRRADARAAPYTSDIYKERLENQGKTKQTKKRSQGATAKDVRAQSFGGTPSASGGVTLRGGNGPAGVRRD